MMTKEEVMDIVSYCKENKVTYEQRLKELGVSQWRFYNAKRKYLLMERDKPAVAGRFIQLGPGRTFVPDSLTAMEGSENRTVKNAESCELKIECQTSRGGMLRMSGKIPASMLAVLVQNL